MRSISTFFVATNGNDGWSGTRPDAGANRTDGPFATLEGARDALRARKTVGGLTAPEEREWL